MKVEVEIAKLATAEPTDAQRRRGRRPGRRCSVVRRIGGAAQDQLDQRSVIEFRCRAHRHRTAVTDDGDAVGDGEHLVEPVRHEQRGRSGVAQPAHHGEEVVDLRLRHRGRGLVEHEQRERVVGVANHRPGDGDADPLRGAEAADRRRDVERVPQ